MQLSGVRLSVRPFRPAAACRFCGFAAVGRAPGGYRSIAARPAGSSSSSGGRMRAVRRSS